MIDWYSILIYTLVAAATFFIMWLLLRCATEWDKWENATPTKKKIRTRRLWIIGILLLGVVTLFMLFPLHVIVSIFIDVPLSAILLLAINLVRYCLAKGRQNKNPKAVTAEELASRRKILIVASVFLAVAIAVLAVFAFLFTQGIAFM